MKKLVALFLMIFMACVSQVGGEIRDRSEVPRISAILAYEKFKTGKTILVDANPEATFSKKHILGSFNIPNDGAQDIARMREMILPFKPEQEIVVYCM
jgi:rhodanese-related sulfurtransferase